jgi:class 3 adenylate cyclase/tetratricopeptide (TPR) repeat protein
VCSVLFCDLVGFTPLSESRDPEDVRELLSGYFDTARTVIGRYGGVVEKFIGDAVMAVWGTPIATEGDTERAVRAALELVDAVAAMGVEVGAPELAARAGVVTGEVAVTIGATNQGMVAGDAVNTAARVQSAGQAGTVLVDEPTRRLAASAIGFDDAGEHQLKGKVRPVRLWEATRVLSGPGGVQRIDGLEAPMIGRDAELRMVKELFHSTVERRVPRLVVISGPAGVGKSRLGWELAKYVDGLSNTVLWHRGRCPSYGDGVAFWALAEIVRQRLGIAEDDPTAVAAEKLATGLADFVVDPDEQNYVAVRLARLLGVRHADEPISALGRDELFAGWRLFFERLAIRDPVVLLIEDGHHADQGLLDFLDHLVDWSKNLPILVVLFTRPELVDVRPAYGVGRNRTTLSLDPLGTSSMHALVDALVPGMPEPARLAITGRAEGIPLFAMEMVRSLIDRDIVAPRDGRYQLVGDVGALTVPETLHALLAARLDALSTDGRRLIADAAVLGTTFSSDALVAVTGGEPSVVEATLTELSRKEVLEITADPLSPERGSYRFSQEMLRQVAYDTLSRRDRKAMHLTVAAYLRASFAGDGEEVSDVIARHYIDAANAIHDDVDVPTIREQAIVTLTRAAKRAERIGSPTRATEAYVTAASLFNPSDGGEADVAAAALWEGAANAASHIPAWTAAIDHANRALTAYAEHEQVRDCARVRSMIGAAWREQGKFDQAREYLEGALEVLRVDPDHDTIRVLFEMSGMALASGEADADRLTAELLTLSQELEFDARMLAASFQSRAIWLNSVSRWPESVAYLREAARLAERAGLSHWIGSAQGNLSEVLVAHDPEAAADAARSATQHARRTGNGVSLSDSAASLFSAQLMLGQWEGASTTMAEAEQSDLEGLNHRRAWLAALRGDIGRAGVLLDDRTELTTDDAWDLASISTTRAFLAIADGQPVDALTHATAALDHSRGLGICFEAMRWGWPLAARAAHDIGDAEAAHQLLARLDAYPAGHHPPMLRAERALVEARLAARDDQSTAADRFAAAVEMLRSMSTPYHLAHGLIDHAEFLTRTSDLAGAGMALDEAGDIAQRLGCEPLRDRMAQLHGVSVRSEASIIAR